ADRRILVGPGDDAAAVRPGRRPLLVTADALVENVHFRAGWAAPAALGCRAWAVTASDLAAMGGVPRFAVLALEASPAMRTADLDALVGGFAAAARREGARLVGGNLVAGPHLALPVAGACRRALGGRAAAFAARAGEDYELVVAVPPAREPALRRVAPRLGCRLTLVGRLLAGRPVVRVRAPDGRVVRVARGGFDHFRR